MYTLLCGISLQPTKYTFSGRLVVLSLQKRGSFRDSSVFSLTDDGIIKLHQRVERSPFRSLVLGLTLSKRESLRSKTHRGMLRSESPLSGAPERFANSALANKANTFGEFRPCPLIAGSALAKLFVSSAVSQK